MRFTEIIRLDLVSLTGESRYKTMIHRVLRHGAFRFLFFFRLAKAFRKSFFLGSLANYFYRRYSIRFQIQIPKTVEIGEGFAMPHHGGIVINSKSKIGKNCTILHNVTLGNTKGGKLPGAPRIGDYVYIGPGAVIVGEVQIGDHVLIAPNAYVNFSIPAHSLVIGNPATITHKKYASANYVTEINL